MVALHEAVVMFCRLCCVQGEKAVKGSHCRQRGENPFCPEETIDPTPLLTIIEDVHILTMHTYVHISCS